MRFLKIAAIAALSSLLISPLAHAAGGAKPLDKPADKPLPDWSFKGPFGKFDKGSVQRGFQVYVEVCASCHGMELMSYRNLGEPGGPFYQPGEYDLTEALVKEFAAQYTVTELDDIGDEITRPARPADKFVSPYPNDQAAKAANGGALPPDFSVLAKARHGGADYIYRLMSSYPDPIDDVVDGKIEFNDGHLKGTLTQPLGIYYNPYFPGDTLANWDGDPRHAPYGGFLAMPSQLSDGRVEYLDGTEATTEQMSEDIAHFLAWAAEPKMENRKSLGLAVMLYLFIFAILLYFSYRRLWRNVEH